MLNTASDGLARLQGESRISANTWREWSSRLGLDPADVVELWDEVCHPLMVASGAAPDIAFVMQLRAIRSDLYIEEFRDEVPATLLTANLLDALQDDRLSGAKARSAVLKLCQQLTDAGPSCPPEQFRRRLVVDLCTAILLAKVMPGDNVSLSRLVRLVIEGRATLDKLAVLALKSTAEEPYAGLVRACLRARQEMDEPAPTAAAAAGKDEADGNDAEGNEDAADAEGNGDGEDDGEESAEERTDEEEEEDDEEDEDDDEDEAAAPQSSGADRFLSAFGSAMEAVYQSEASEVGYTQESNERLAARQRAISQFHPLRSRIPSMEEAQKLSRQAGGNDSGRQRALDRARASASSKKSAPRPVMAARPQRPSAGGGAPGASGGGASAPSLPAEPGGASKGSAVIKAGAAGKGAPRAASSAGASATSIGASTAGASTAGASTAGASTAGASTAGASTAGPSTAGVSAAGAAAPGVPGDPASGEAAAAAEPVEAAPAAPEVGVRIVVDDIPRHELSEVVSRIGQLLGFLEELDARVWQLVCEPAMELAQPRQLAEDLLSEDSGAQQAYGAVRIVASKQALRRILAMPPDRRLNERRFDLELAAFINTVSNARRDFEPDSRQLIPLPKVLDYAAAGLVRLEALRTALSVARESGADFDAAAATAACDEALSDITYMAEQHLVEATRERADADVAAVGEAVVADLTVDRLVEESCAYARQLEADGNTASVETVDQAIAAAPLAFDGIEPGDELPGQLPARFAEPTKLGEVHDRVRSYVLERFWPLLQPRHRPEEAAARLDSELRAALKGTIRMEPRRERHQKNPKVALAVIGLETLTGNPELAHLFVRVTVDGKLLYIEDYEDGTYIDLFERRKNTKRQMHARARDRAQDDSSGELQMGSNYLYSVGRTNTPFGRTQAEVMKGCVRSEDGEPVIYPIF